jgi:hypothetical protein
VALSLFSGCGEKVVFIPCYAPPLTTKAPKLDLNGTLTRIDDNYFKVHINTIKKTTTFVKDCMAHDIDIHSTLDAVNAYRKKFIQEYKK